MIFYRAMCDSEANETLKTNRFAWNSKFKWFGPIEFVTERVMDGKFNNSKFVSDRYSRLLKFEIEDSALSYFSKCGNKEFMLACRKSPLVKILSIDEVDFP